MNKKITGKNSGSSRFFSSKTFYITLTVCAVVVVCAIYYTISTTLDSLNEPFEKLENGGNGQWNSQSGQDVNKNQSKIPIEKSSSSQMQSPSQSSSQQQSQPQEDSQEPDNGADQYSNLFIMPLTGDITNPYSNGELVKSKTLKDWRTHDGIDIKGKVGDPVNSVADGKVVGIIDDPLWGVIVVVDHFSGHEGRYVGLGKNIAVKKGQVIKVGDLIGAVSETSQMEIADEPHLHFEMKKDGKYIDPMSILKK